MHASFLLFDGAVGIDRCRETTLRKPVAPDSIQVRFLRHDDLQALTELEHAVWAPNQAASTTHMYDRISRYPQLAIGAFCEKTGRALASLFAQPTHPEAIRHAINWQECVHGAQAYRGKATSALFGVSLSSIHADAAKAIFEFFWPYALKNGWREMFLGSPVPGLRGWLQENPDKPVEDYVFAKRNGLPCDPQLRYYHRKGFQRIVAVRPDYFPHEASLNYGVILGGQIPLSILSPLWQRMPLSWLQALKKWLFVLR